MRLAYSLWEGLSTDTIDSSRHSGFREQEDDGSSTEVDNRRIDCAGDQQTAAAGTRSISVDAKALPNLEKVNIICPQMKRIIDTTEEQNQFLGPNMEKIAEVPLSEKMSVLSRLTTLTIDIQNILQSWTDFQHHLAVTTPAIVEVYVQKRPIIRLHSPL